MPCYPFASQAASITCPELRQRFVNASRTLHRLPPAELLRYVRRRPHWFAA